MLISVDTTELQQLLDNMVQVSNGHQSAIDTLNVTIASLTARLDKLEAQPSPVMNVPAGMRGLWIQPTGNVDMLRSRLQVAVDYGANAVYWYVGTGSGVRFNNTQGIPSDNLLSVAIAEAQQRGLVLWPCLPAKYFVPLGHPEWNLRGQIPGCDDSWLDFRVPAARDLLAELAHDLITGYSVPGVVLDYLRYHRAWFPGARDAGLLSIDNITETVRSIRAVLPAGAQLVASPICRLDDTQYSAYNCAQDWPLWLRGNLVDWLMPMTYQNHAFLLERIAEWERVTGLYPQRICPLLSIERALQPPEEKPLSDWRREIQTAIGTASAVAVFDESLVHKYPMHAAELRNTWA